MYTFCIYILKTHILCICVYFKCMHILAKGNENTNSNETFTPMFIVALFTIAKIWKPPKCPLTEQWIEMWYTCTMDSVIKKNEILPFATAWMTWRHEAK